MMPLGTQRVNGAGHLEIGGCDAVALAERFGTPLYVIDEELVRANCRAYRRAFAAITDRYLVCYAGKALLTTAVARLVASEGLGLDVASAGELLTAIRAGLDPALLVLHGNVKSAEEMRLALELGVGRVVVDSLPELDDWQQMATALDRRVRVLVRVNPNVKPHTHTAVQVGQVDSKFGLSIHSGAALEAMQRAVELDRIELLGCHYHIGSQVLGWQAFSEAARQLADFLAEFRDRLGFELPEVNLGGGVGIRYLPEHRPPSIEEFVARVMEAFIARLDEHSLALPMVLIEPGRSIIGEAGLTLYRVGVVKSIPGVRTYVSVDGGLSDNPRPQLYDAAYHVFLANRPADEPDTVVTVAGKHCETDTLFPDVSLPAPQAGDVLAVQSTGAYNYAMASNYNRYPRPAMVLANQGRAELIVRRETIEDLLRCDLMPVRLTRGSGG